MTSAEAIVSATGAVFKVARLKLGTTLVAAAALFWIVNAPARSVQTRSRSELFAWVKLSVKGRVAVFAESQWR